MIISPGAWLGILGGGQLGRMFAMAAHRFGYRVMAIDPDLAAPIAPTVDRFLCASLDDVEALDAMAASCAAVTIETENIPAIALERLAKRVRLAPSPMAVSIAQDRCREKRFLHANGFATVPFSVIESMRDVEQAGVETLLPGVLKRSRNGYDGKGQAAVADRAALRRGWVAMGGEPCVLERRIQLVVELSVIVARDFAGNVVSWPVAENHHRNGILDMTILPGRIPSELVIQASAQAERIAELLDYRGVLCVEFFVACAGALLVNEIAPRPHNSGHATIEVATTSQFEQQVRVLTGLPLGATRTRGVAVMQNLLGEHWRGGEPAWPAILSEPGTHLHLYGKHEPRPGRKMGHFTVIAETVEDALCARRRVLDRMSAAAVLSG